MQDGLEDFHSMSLENENIFPGVPVVFIVWWGKMSATKYIKADVEKNLLWSSAEKVTGDE